MLRVEVPDSEAVQKYRENRQCAWRKRSDQAGKVCRLLTGYEIIEKIYKLWHKKLLKQNYYTAGRMEINYIRSFICELGGYVTEVYDVLVNYLANDRQYH